MRIGGAHPDLLWLLPITAALLDGPETGAIVGFWSGLAFDLVLPTPFGLSALVGLRAWATRRVAHGGGRSPGHLAQAGGRGRGERRQRTCCSPCSEQSSANSRWCRSNFSASVLVVGHLERRLGAARQPADALGPGRGRATAARWCPAQADERDLVKRTLRHPIRGDRLHPKPSTRPPAPARLARRRQRQPRMRPRKSVNVGVHRRLARGGGPSRPNLRLRVVGVVVLVLFGVLVLRLWTLQVVDGKSYAAAVTRNQVRVVSVAAPRGEIVDRNDTVLVGEHSRSRRSCCRVSRPRRTLPSSARWRHWSARRPRRCRPPSRTSSTAPTNRCRSPTNVSAATVQYLQTHQSEYPGRDRPDGHAAHLSPGRDHGHPRARATSATSPAATWPPIPTRGTPRAVRSGSLGHRGPVRAVPAGRHRAPGPLGERRRATWSAP